MTLPNFLVCGAAKAGTTSLWRYLRQHPDVYMPDHKEAHFFDIEGSSHAAPSPAEYEAFFEPGRDAHARGEATPSYLSSPGAPAVIKALIPEVKLIAILRDPAARAYSAFLHNRRRGREPCPNFSEAIDAERARIDDGWSPGFHYVTRGKYHAQVTNYLSHFERSQLKLYLYEDLGSRPQEVVADIFSFLGVDPGFGVDTTKRANITGVPRSELIETVLKGTVGVRRKTYRVLPRTLSRSLSRLRATTLQRPPPLDPAARNLIVDELRDDIGSLQTFLDRDLSAWLK